MAADPDSRRMAPDEMFASAACSETALPTRRRDNPGWKLIPIVTASGFAGLGYEIVWTRVLSLALGTEMMAVLGAVTGFFAGLALGAFLLDRLIRQARSPGLVYAALEAVIGLWGVISVWLLPSAGRALSPLLGTEPAPALLWAASFALPALVLLPATAAMGATLAALERMTAAASGDSWITAGVYGANTAGAVAGTLISTFFLLPAFGLSGTLLCLAATNALCALGALAVGATTRAPAAVVAERRPQRVGDLRLNTALFVTGLLGIAFEVLVVRMAAQVLQNTIYTFAGLLAAYLFGTAAGSILWQSAGRRAQHESLGWLLAGTSLACLATAALTPLIARIAEAAVDIGVASELAVAMTLFLIPSAAMGALFGHLAQQVRDQRGSLGWAVGINSVGAALAPLLTAQLLIPAFGAWTALIPVALAYLALLPVRRAMLVWATAPAVAGLVLWAGPAPSLIKVPPGGTLLTVREGPMATASVVNDASGARYLEVNGHFRMGGTNSVRSDHRQAMLPLLLHPGPHRALFLGIGTGATVVGGARMPGVSVHGVELLPEVVELLPLFTDPAAPAPLPPITVADARRYVTADTRQYDVIIADLFHPALDGSGALYTTEHFAAVRKRLVPGGLFCQWLPLYQLDLPSLRAIIRGFLDVYPNGSAWLNHYSVYTPMLALIGQHEGGGELDVDALAARLSDRAIGAVARPLGFEKPIDLLGQYIAGPRVLAEFAGEGPRNTDDYPLVALDASRNVRALSAPPSNTLLALTRALQPAPSELLQGGRDTLAERLSAYWRARNRFLEAGVSLKGEPRGFALIEAASPGLLESLRLSAEFDPAYGPLMAMARTLMASDRRAAAHLLHQIEQAAPSRKEARELLSREFNE